MTTRLKNIMQTVCIVLFLMLFPGTAHLQEEENPAPPEVAVPQAEAPVPAPESVAIEPAAAEMEAVAVEAVPAEAEAVAVELEAAEAEVVAAEPGPAEVEAVAVEPEPVEAEAVAGEPSPAEAEAAAVEPEPTELETAVAEPAPAAAKGAPYIVKKGDTLWDISNTFLKDPFLWPFLWKANPGISNPDLIYPGNKIVIPSLAPIEQALIAEPAPKEPAEEPVAVAEEPVKQDDVVEAPGAAEPTAVEESMPVRKKSRFSLPEEKVYPIIDKYAMLSMGFVDMDKSDDRIAGAPETGKSIFGYDDIVYVSMNDRENVSIGDKYLIFTPLHKVKHPKTGKKFGKLIKGLGILQIVTKNASSDVLTARITLSFDAIEKGNMLTPYQEPMPIYRSPQAKAKDISGYILEVTDKRTINAQTDVVYLDKGTADGVEPGDRFRVYEEPAKRDFPRKEIGEVQVLIVKQHTSTAIVQKSSEAMVRGNAVDFKK
jgi:LysM repeat protein